MHDAEPRDLPDPNTDGADAAAARCRDVAHLTERTREVGIVAVEREVRAAARAQRDPAARQQLGTLADGLGACAWRAGTAPEELPLLLHDRLRSFAPALHEALVWPPLPHVGLRLRDPLARGGLARVLEHPRQIEALVGLADGRLLVGGAFGNLHVWDACGQLLARVGGEARVVVGFSFLGALPDGRVVAASFDRLALWDVEQLVVEGQRVAGEAVELRLVGAGDVQRVVSARSGVLLATQRRVKVEESFSSMAVLDARRVVTGSDDGSVMVWDVDSGALLRELRGHAGPVRAVAALPGGRVVSGSDDATLRIWDVETGRTTSTLAGHTTDVVAVAALSDGRIVSGAGRFGSDLKLRVWDATGAPLATIDDSPADLAVLPSGRVVAGSTAGFVRVYDLDRPGLAVTLAGHEGRVTHVAALPDGRVASSDDACQVRIWNVAGREPEAANRAWPWWRLSDEERARGEDGHRSPVVAVAALRRGRAASGAEDGSVRVWDVRSGRALATYRPLLGALKGLVAAPDDGILLGSKADMMILDPDTGEQRGYIPAGGGPLGVLPKGWVAHAQPDSEYQLRSNFTGSRSDPYKGHKETIRALIVLAGGRVVSGADDRTALVRGPGTSVTHRAKAAVLALAALPGDRVVSGCEDGSLVVWHSATGRTIATLRGHEGPVRAVAALPDGRVVSGSDDRTVRIWDFARGESVATLAGDFGLRCLAVVEGGQLLAGDRIGNVWFIDAHAPATRSDGPANKAPAKAPPKKPAKAKAPARAPTKKPAKKGRAKGTR